MDSRPKTERLLVVDDEPLARTALLYFLQVKGFAVEAVASGDEALERLRHEPFDLVITDNQMTGMSGLELAQAVKANWPALPVVMFTAHPPGGLPTGVDLVLTKPSDVSILRQSVRQILDKVRGSAT